MLTSKQEVLLEIAKKQGFLTITDTYRIYNSQAARIQAIKQLIKQGFLKRSLTANRFDYQQK